KKAAFLRQAAIELALTNVTVVCERVEAWQPPERFDVVISRAFAELARFVAVAGHLCADDGVMAAMKGVYPHEELTAAIQGYRVERVEHINVPGLAADRHLVLLRRNAVTAVNS
ncbi:MAG TPA: RsmG family class I SAM-dependent methyltransferase, partial [Burkholderiales bacterium]|nr:RsmG family class I SAM-dependent methyltransferase [Burkholderiales bacterium]